MDGRGAGDGIEKKFKAISIIIPYMNLIHQRVAALMRHSEPVTHTGTERQLKLYYIDVLLIVSYHFCKYCHYCCISKIFVGCYADHAQSHSFVLVGKTPYCLFHKNHVVVF